MFNLDTCHPDTLHIREEETGYISKPKWVREEKCRGNTALKVGRHRTQ